MEASPARFAAKVDAGWIMLARTAIGSADAMHYSTGVLGQGGAPQAVARIIFSGCLGEAFVEFARNRGARLGLRDQIRMHPDTVEVFLQGPEALIDAFEITCSLGPMQCDVDTWERVEVDAQTVISDNAW